MYNTTYECVKPITVYIGKEREPMTIARKTKWRLVWCGGSQSFKELTGKNGPNEKVITISLPDELVDTHFKKV